MGNENGYYVDEDGLIIKTPHLSRTNSKKSMQQNEEYEERRTSYE